ncbi:tubulin epsilon and delta complex protein 1 [Diachasma alloeum]|uniref:tubulin epsilon and delta complex protein 1 n=1 Tax=Diachasma alloeum TaxID=454923 RepID=UPI0007380F84|nr:tubulin epsilon and delta complex protein 1 [Diachasma alloeum]
MKRGGLIMSDVKNVINLLCKHIGQCTEVQVHPEYFKAAKYNEDSPEVVQCFWTVLNILSYYAIKKTQPGIDFQHYDELKSTKLYFAYLQYPSIEFYGLLDKNARNNRELLLALAWLIGMHNVLETAMRFKLVESILGGECVQSGDSLKRKQEENNENENVSSELIDQIHSIVHKCMTVSNNLKDINELISERIKSTSKVHAASSNSCGLPHLNVPEMSIIKQFVTHEDKYSEHNEKNLVDLQRLGVMLETHSMWRRNEEIFFDWMGTVLEEHKRSPMTEFSEKTVDEFSTFICILRHLTKKKIHSLKHSDGLAGENISKIPCTSRFSRTQERNTNANLWGSEISQRLEEEQAKTSEKMKELASELKAMLKSIPNCIQI